MSARAAAVGGLLRALLCEDARYREHWMRRAHRNSAGQGVNFAAVSEVVAEYLWDAGERPETMEPRALRDRIRRAVIGESCSPVTLTWLVAAFGMTQEDATVLSQSLHGMRGSSATVGQFGLGDLPEIQHRTRSLNEFHTIGANRLPRRHRTVQVIESLVDDYTIYPYRFDTPHARVLVEHGGTAGPVRQDQAGLWAVDITLVQPLKVGETASVVYETLFDYPSPPPPEFRRGARTRIDSVNLWVRFHPSVLPSKLWWAVWEDQPTPSHRERISLDVDYSAQRFLTLVERTIVGFTWDW